MEDDGGVETDAGVDGEVEGDAFVNPAWFEPDPQGRVTEGDRTDADPEMMVVSPPELMEAWQAFAVTRTLHGVHTGVVDVDAVLEAYPEAEDYAEALRSYLADQVADYGLRFALLGGDAMEVPYQRIRNEITVPMVGDTYTSKGPSQLYFANLEADWDADGDGKLGELGEDMTLADGRTTHIAVGRVSADLVGQVDDYHQKVADYVTVHLGRTDYPLLLSDLAASVPLVGEIDGAEANELTVADFFPQPFKDHARRLYATQEAVDTYGGQLLTAPRVEEAFDEGYPLVFHSGHGSHGWLTNSLDIAFVNDLDNALAPVLVSCACLAGNFADVADTPTCDGWNLQTPDLDSAGERFILSDGGGVAYVGNTATGLGPIGGSQFLHAMMEGVFVEGVNLIGEAVNYARGRFREIPFDFPLVSDLMDDACEWWTQNVVILHGDPSLPIRTALPLAVDIETPASYGPGYTELTVTVTGPDAQPLPDLTVSAYKYDDFYLRAYSDAQGRVVFRFVPYGPDDLHIGVAGGGVATTVVTVPPNLSGEL
jgi:hypothetical protein